MPGFRCPWQISLKWIKDRYKLAQLPNFTDATLASLRTTVGATGQREVLLGGIVGIYRAASFHSSEFMGFTMNHSEPQKANF